MSGRSALSDILITAVIKARNEGHRLKVAMDSLNGFADEVIVVDDASSDDTAEVARTCGATVISSASQDGVINRLDVIGFQAARGRYIARLDADELMQPELARTLRGIALVGEVSGVRFARMNMMFGGWARYGGWFRNDQLRFFRADSWDKNWKVEDIHSQVPVNGVVLTLPCVKELSTVHNDYDSVGEFVRRSYLGYALSDARCLAETGMKPTVGRLVWRPARRCIGRLTIGRGYRDGYRGVLLACLLGGYDLMVEAYLWDITRKIGEEDDRAGRQV